jgi:hypothetical protein
LFAIFRLFGPLKALLVFFLPNDYFFFSSFFLQTDFFSVKSAFRSLKRNLKQDLNVFQELVMAEATAILYAAEFSRDLGLHNIVLKGDSLPVINALKEEGLRWSRYGQIVEDIREVL